MLTRERRADFRFIVLTRDKCKYKKKKKSGNGAADVNRIRQQ